MPHPDISRIIKLYTDLQHGDCWIDVNFKLALQGVDAAKAAHKASPGTNSIWQLVNHLTYWRTVVVNRLQGSVDQPPFTDFRQPDEITAVAWQQTKIDFEAAYHLLINTIKHFNPVLLDEPSPKAGQTYYDLLLGSLQHDTYHMGQLMLLKKHFS